MNKTELRRSEFKPPWWLYLAWFVPVLESVAFPSSLGANQSILVPVGFVAWQLIRGKMIILVHALPFFCLLSPLAAPLFGSILYSEVILLLLLPVVLFQRSMGKRFKVYPVDVVFFVMSCLLLSSYLISFEYQNLWKGFINTIFWSVAYLITRVKIRDFRSLIEFLTSVFVSASFGAIILIFFYLNGINLNDFMDRIGFDVLAEGEEDLRLSLQATYFYTNVFYVFGVAIIAMPFVVNHVKGWFARVVMWLLFGILALGLVANFNKTAMLALSFVLLVAAIRSLVQNRLREVGFTLSLIVISLFITGMQNENLDRKFAFDSFLVRLNVFQSAYDVLMTEPKLLIFGAGPESTIRLNENRHLLAAKTGAAGTEGAIDSAHISYIFEYGILFSVAYHIFGIMMMLRFLRYQRFFSTDSVNASYRSLGFMFIYIFLFIYIVGFAQVLSMGKVAVVLVQVMACSVRPFWRTASISDVAPQYLKTR